MFKNALAPVFAALALAACSGADPAFEDTTSDNVEAIKSTCGGIAALQCPANYDCVITSKTPDATGTCKKRKACIQNQVCAISEHFDVAHCKCVLNQCIQSQMCVKGSHWDAQACHCEVDVTCQTLTCVSGYHCEEKGINGGAIAVCIHN